MLAQPWMNRTPVPKKTPLQQAQNDMRQWKQQLDEAEARAAQCRKEFYAAVDRVGACR